MKCGKAVGPDIIPVEAWKVLGSTEIDWLTEVFTIVMQKEEVRQLTENKSMLRCATGTSDDFEVTVALHQGSALSPFLFDRFLIDWLTRSVQNESPWDMLFADDIVLREGDGGSDTETGKRNVGGGDEDAQKKEQSDTKGSRS
ncbi:uncharacterized protein LOC125025503 [Penaeus chinensis]|uniref:uncharacterized protein LOC125025503 n=1 Tax=Penaeus chinensis TaxID=139456 RepID=UPI001FB5F064|nr:uncharacterized protein LOC125025503 [Penaeus chinensis]